MLSSEQKMLCGLVRENMTLVDEAIQEGAALRNHGRYPVNCVALKYAGDPKFLEKLTSSGAKFYSLDLTKAIN